jgi:hypothetical protein
VTSKSLRTVVVLIAASCLLSVQLFSACATCEGGCCSVLGSGDFSSAIEDKGCSHHNAGCCSNKIASCQKEGDCTCGALIPAFFYNSESEDSAAIHLISKAAKNILSADSSQEVPAKPGPLAIASFQPIYLRTLSILI